MKTFTQLASKARLTVEYKTEGTILEFTEQVVNRMRALKLTKTELASKMGVSPAFITKVLSGGNNFSIETMCKMAFALNADIKITIAFHQRNS